jgi:hypothetical protein
MLTGLIKFIVVEGETYVSVNMIFYNGMNFTIKNLTIIQFSETLFVTGNM